MAEGAGKPKSNNPWHGLNLLIRGLNFLCPSIMTPAPQYAPRPLGEQTRPATDDGGAASLKISIVIPTLNQGRFLEKAITSILEQEYPALELIVIDGGSTDDSRSIITKYAARLAWWCCEPDRGQTDAINKGFARASGEVMAWLNGDDLLAPGSLARIAACFARHPETDVVYGQRILIDEQGRDIGRWILPPHSDSVLTWADFVPQETLFWRRLWKKIGGKMDDTFHFALDWDLLIRFRQAGARMVRLPFFLGCFRLHAAQKTTAGIADIGFAEMDRIRETALGYRPGLFRIVMGVAPFLAKTRCLELLWKSGVIHYE